MVLRVGGLVTAGGYPVGGQPAFFARQTTQVNNVTGDGTIYTVIFDTEDYDQAANYNNATGVFTAPVTGKYDFSAAVYMLGITSGMTRGELRLTTTSRTYFAQYLKSGAVQNSGEWEPSASWSGVPMTAGDTARLQIFVTGGTLVVDVYGDATTNAYTSFSGRLAF